MVWWYDVWGDYSSAMRVLLAAAGSAGDRLSHGEESDGASACCHPAAGEHKSCFLSFQPVSIKNTYLYDAQI